MPPRDLRRAGIPWTPPEQRATMEPPVHVIVTADYIRVLHTEPHAGRGRQLLAAHPELRALAGPDRSSAAWVAALVLLQGGIALLAGGYRWYVWLPCAYVVGATIDHALWVLIHECSHNLVFRSRTGNRLL